MLKRFHEWLLDWKPIHLCWLYKRLGKPIPRYLIGGGGSPPSVTTNAATSVGSTSATLNGEVTSDGGRTLSASGFTISSTDTTPTLGEGGVTDVSHATPAVEVYSEPSPTLSAGTTYYYQAYATNDKGTTYGGVQNFTTFFIRTHTTDALVKDRFTKTHTTNANLQDAGVYTYEDKATLPTTDALLANSYTDTDRTNVLTDNNVYKDLDGNNYMIEQWWEYNDNSTDGITPTWKGKSTAAPTASTVYLQIYNYNTTSWETLDSDSTTAADTEFTLTGAQTTSLSNYYTTGDKVALRVYQQVV